MNYCRFSVMKDGHLPHVTVRLAHGEELTVA